MILKKDYSFVVPPQSDGIRVDKFLSSVINGLTRSAFLTGDSEILIDGSVARKSTKIKTGQVVELKYSADVFSGIIPQDIALNIVYEDDCILVIDKAQGMVVHPGSGVNQGTLVNALAFRYGNDFINRFLQSDIARPGIVHRLDKETSGLMVVALTQDSLSSLSSQFSNKETEKHYYALSEGFFTRKKGRIEGYITRNTRDRKSFVLTQSSGKYSCTDYEVESQYDKAALVRLNLYTGRTHQIRVHLKSINHSIIGDTVYGGKLFRDPGISLMLHSSFLAFNHPLTGKRMSFSLPIPPRFTFFINNYLQNN